MLQTVLLAMAFGTQLLCQSSAETNSVARRAVLAGSHTRCRRPHAVQVYERDTGSYGTRTFPAAASTAEWIGAGCPQLRGKRTLEIGSGTGLVALTLAATGMHVVACDFDRDALHLVERAAGDAGIAVECRHLDICGSEPLPGPFDLLVAVDLLYTDALATAVARRVVEALRAGALVLVADPSRSGRATFVACLAEEGLSAHFQAEWGSFADWVAAAADPDVEASPHRSDVGSESDWCAAAGKRLLLLHEQDSTVPGMCESHLALIYDE
jgi:predicted nicotinamide N-methyase